MPRVTQRPEHPELEQYLGKVGKDVKGRRELRRLSQEESARQAGIPVGALRDIEQGYDARIGYHYLNAKHLNLPFGYGHSGDLAEALRAFGDVLRGLGERMDRLDARIDQLIVVQTERR